MKLISSLLLLASCLTISSAAAQEPVETSPPSTIINNSSVAVNATSPTPPAIGARFDLGKHRCDPPRGNVNPWYYNSKDNWQRECAAPGGGKDFSMLNAYRAGGTVDVHWKYTNNVDDPACLNNWAFYSTDGNTLIANIQGRTTTVNDPKRWCALPVYRSNGVLGKQWAHCNCYFVQPPSKPAVNGRSPHSSL